MSHHDAQHYAAKHEPDTSVNPAIAAEVQHVVEHGKITCVQAHQIAAKLEVSPVDVGKTCDLLEIRIAKCQLGLFAKRETPDSRVRLEDLPAAVLASLENLRDTDTSLSCRNAWELADQQTVLKGVVGAACDALEIKIVECQLGTF